PGEEESLARALQIFAGGVDKRRELFDAHRAGDVAIRIDRVDDGERLRERPRGRPIQLEDDSRTPGEACLQNAAKRAVLQDEQLAQVAAEPQDLRLRAVDADALGPCLQQADLVRLALLPAPARGRSGGNATNTSISVPVRCVPFATEPARNGFASQPFDRRVERRRSRISRTSFSIRASSSGVGRIRARTRSSTLIARGCEAPDKRPWCFAHVNGIPWSRATSMTPSRMNCTAIAASSRPMTRPTALVPERPSRRKIRSAL